LINMEQQQEQVQLRSGGSMPKYGLGTWTATDKECHDAVLAALNLGIRLIDTAAYYDNEQQVGEAIKASGIDRGEIFVVTKLPGSGHGNPEEALKKSLELLGMEYVDLYLIHSPSGKDIVNVWKSMLSLRKQGLARAIGVSNFGVEQLKSLEEVMKGEAGEGKEEDILPEVNQVEYHVFLQQKDLMTYLRSKGIVPMGYCPLARCKQLNEHPQLTELASKHGKTEPQVMLRWSLQSGVITIPKSVNVSRIKENLEVLNFELSDEDMAALDALDIGFKASQSVNTQDLPWDEIK